MSSDGGSARNTLASQCSTSSSGSTDSARRRREYWKKDRKIVRILTVLAYIVSVSTAAVLLSTYYVFLWNPEPKNAQGRSRGYEKPLTLALGPPEVDVERPSLLTGRMAASSFALSASQVDLRVSKSSDVDVKTNTKVYQQKQIPIPQSTVVMPTTEMSPIRIPTTMSWMIRIPKTEMPVESRPTLLPTMEMPTTSQPTPIIIPTPNPP